MHNPAEGTCGRCFFLPNPTKVAPGHSPGSAVAVVTVVKLGQWRSGRHAFNFIEFLAEESKVNGCGWLPNGAGIAVT